MTGVMNENDLQNSTPMPLFVSPSYQRAAITF